MTGIFYKYTFIYFFSLVLYFVAFFSFLFGRLGFFLLDFWSTPILCFCFSYSVRFGFFFGHFGGNLFFIIIWFCRHETSRLALPFAASPTATSTDAREATEQVDPHRLEPSGRSAARVGTDCLLPRLRLLYPPHHSSGW